MSVGNWSTETYRLDEVTNKFSLPCVVCFSEGFMDATESESISKDDVIKIDKRVTLQKVAAEFMNHADDFSNTEIPKFEPDDTYVDLKVDEILIPLNYGGKVMVHHAKQICYGVNNLRRIFPRYAQVLSNVDIVEEENGTRTIQADTFIELDRIIPGTKSTIDHLVVKYNCRGKFAEATVPVSNKGKFRILPDNNEYTLHEAIERYDFPVVVTFIDEIRRIYTMDVEDPISLLRYGFPVVVTFIDDEIRRIYTMDIEEGVDNMKLISATVRLKRLEQQDAIIGHYKPLEDNIGGQKQDSEYFARRSLVVLPLDNSDIREIQVHVLLDADEEVYDDIFLVSNKSRELNVVLDGTLYVDFAKKSGPRHITTPQLNKLKGKADPVCPPRPPKSAAHHQVVQTLNQKLVVQKQPAQSTQTLVYDDAEIGGPVPTKHAINTQKKREFGNNNTPTKASADGRTDYYDNSSGANIDNRKSGGYLKPIQRKEVQLAKPHSRLPKPDPIVIKEDLDLYEEVSASSMTKQPTSSLQSTVSPTLAEMNFDKYTGVELPVKEEKKSALQKLKNKVTGGKGGKEHKANYSPTGKLSLPFFKKDKPVPAMPDGNDVTEDDLPVYDYPDETEIIQLQSKMKDLSEKDKTNKSKKPVALILPNNAAIKSQNVKPFNTLTKIELELRLIQCGMNKFAATCRDKELDGKFFDTISNDILQQEPFSLSQFELVKLERIKQDWIPS